MAYELNGIQYPSVTTITSILDKPGLLGWAARCAVEHIQENWAIMTDVTDVHRKKDVFEAAAKAYSTKRQEAASSGTEVHRAIEAYIAGLAPESYLTTPEAKAGFDAFLSWESKNHVKWLETEVEVYCISRGYAGRLDAIAEVNGHRTLVDIKTGRGTYPEHEYQVCAYRQAYNEMYPEKPVDNLAILHLDKETATPTFKPIESEIGRKTLLFNTLASAYYLLANRRLKNNPFVAAAKSDKAPF